MFKKIIHVLSIVLLVILALIVVYSLASRIMGKTPSLFGYYFFRVSSESMKPTFETGDVILVHSVDASDIQRDDIITFKSKEGSMYGRDVTHRVVTEPVVKNNTYYYQTQGDAPGAPLDEMITYDQVEGKYMCKLTVVGKVYSFFCTPTGVMVLIGIIVLLFGYEMVAMFTSFKKMDATDDLLCEPDPQTDVKKDDPEKAEPDADDSAKDDSEKDDKPKEE